MRIAPTLNFLLNHGEGLHTNTYLHRDSQLSGIVVFYTLYGKFMNGWRYRDGKITAALVAKTKVDIDDLNAPGTRGWWTGQEDGGSFGLDEVIITGNHQWPPWMCTQTFVPVNHVNENTSSYLMESIDGSGSGGSSVSNASECAPNASQIFSNWFLSCDDWSRLEEKVNRLKENCMGRALFNQLNPWPVQPWSIGFHNQESSVINHEERRITLSRTGSDVDMFHELFHAIQVGDRNVAREAEAWFAMFLYAKNNPNFGPENGDLWNSLLDPTHSLAITLRQLYNRYLDHRGRLRGNMTSTHVNNFLIRDTAAEVGLFGQLQWRYDNRLAPVTDNRYGSVGINHFRNLQQIAQDC